MDEKQVILTLISQLVIQFYTISQPVIHYWDMGFFAKSMAYFYEKNNR